ncbi:MAG: alanine racemase [Bacteroidetes bacterium]|nr:alanine racemase [Bacteroidota bacterium]MCL5738088.1 alanine racemase [Bacteroidota bacterium]
MRATRAEVNLSAIQFNIKQVARKVSGNVRILGVVKANAYGHGMAPVAKAALEAGASYLGVALAEEGVELRRHTGAPILVFSPPLEDSLESYIRFDLDATITSIETAYALNSIAKMNGKKARVQIKVDTGMGRLGFFPKIALDAVRVITNLESVSLVGVYSHFATSDETNKEFARRQLYAFKEVVAAMKDIGLKSPLFHVANSGAILDMPDSYFDMVRPGIMTYGYYPSLETSESVDIRPSLSLKSSVVQVKTFQAGMSISYGRKFFTKSNNRIAVVPIGYGDGFTRLLTGKAAVLIKGKKYPVIGSITMDHLMVDVGSDYEAQTGDEVTLIGKSGNERITAWDIASSLGTIPYEVLCMINNRVPRMYNNSTLTD